MYSKALVNSCLAMLCRPFGDLNVFGYAKGHQRAYITQPSTGKVTKGPT